MIKIKVNFKISDLSSASAKGVADVHVLSHVTDPDAKGFNTCTVKPSLQVSDDFMYKGLYHIIALIVKSVHQSGLHFKISLL